MTRMSGSGTGRALFLLALAALAVAAESRAAPAREPLAIADVHWTGDFDAMLQRRIIRIYAPYSRSLYFIDRGRERGVGAELARDFERWINRKYARRLGDRPCTIYIGAVAPDRLLDGLVDGRADIAIGDLTDTPLRRERVDFVAPDASMVNVEVLVTGPKSPAIANERELAGKTVQVRRSSTYFASLMALDEGLRKARRPEVRLTLVPEDLDDEDMLEMLNAGLLQAIVVDAWKARMWSSALPHIKVHEDIVLRQATRAGWAIRKHSPQLAAELREFYVEWVRKEGVIPYLQREYMSTIVPLTDPSGAADRERYDALHALFERYGQQYRFDPLLLAAQGYQESGLDQSKRSYVGAIGVMQLMPATGRALAVGDIHEAEANIHAGAKYMDELVARHFPDAKLDALNRELFALASYNAGPEAIARIRREAGRRGFDPDKWFNSVEVIAAERIGLQTPTYVRNIYKYYVAYSFMREARANDAPPKATAAPGRN